MISARSTTHAADALALLTSAYKGRTVIEAIIRAFANRTQEVENALWALSDAVQLTNIPVGVWLDALGEIAGEPRLNRVDADYLQAVRIKLRVNRSRGRTIDIIDILQLLGSAFQYAEDGANDPACFRVDVYSVAYPNTIARLLKLERAAGTRVLLASTDYARAPIVVGGNVLVATLIWGETTWAEASFGTDQTSWGMMTEASAL